MHQIRFNQNNIVNRKIALYLAKYKRFIITSLLISLLILIFFNISNYILIK